MANQGGLGRCFVVVDKVSELLQVALDRRSTRFNQGFEALLRVGFTNGVLPHFKAEKIKAAATIQLGQCMAQTRLARFQLQTHRLQPLYDSLLTLLNDLEVLMQHHEIISKTDHREFCCLGGDLLLQDRF